jgi:hypothetical protein
MILKLERFLGWLADELLRERDAGRVARLQRWVGLVVQALGRHN